MNTAIASSSGGNEGIGFTIPINMVKIVARQLVERGAVIRAYLGVGLDANFGPAKATSVGLAAPQAHESRRSNQVRPPKRPNCTSTTSCCNSMESESTTTAI